MDLHQLIADWHIENHRAGRRYWSHAAPRITTSMSAWRMNHDVMSLYVARQPWELGRRNMSQHGSLRSLPTMLHAAAFA
jgi:hypothetical protein